MKDKTAEVSTSVKSATKDAGKWVATQSSQKAKAALEQAKTKLSFTEKFTLYGAEKISKLSRRGFTHLFMFLVMIIYSAIGAVIYMVVEGTNEEVTRIRINTERENLATTIISDTKDISNQTEYHQIVKDLIYKYEETYLEAFKQGPEDEKNDLRQWTFWKAMFFSSTISTTIGYGNVSPSGYVGQSITIVYALIGIPLFLIILADFGTLFTRALKQMFILWAKIKKTSAYNRARNHKAVKRVSTRLKFITDILTCNWDSDDDDDAPKKHKTPEDYFTDGNFNIPVTLALGILGVYIFIGSLVFTIWEKWTTFEAFYFIFISMTTIGFGDYVPDHPGFMMAVTVYIVFGLSLTAMSINVIQEKLTDSFRKASLKLKESFKTIKGGPGDEEEGETQSYKDQELQPERTQPGSTNGPNIVVDVAVESEK